jgi:hypothetical protein
LRRAILIGVVAAAGLLGAGEPTVAQKQRAHPFVGVWYWNGPQTCKKGHEGDDVAIEIQPRRMFLYETKCDIRSMRKLSDTAYRFQLSCRGEGERWQVESIFSLLEKSKVNDDLLVRLQPKDGAVTAYRRCP